MYAKCVTDPGAVFNRTLKFTFMNEGGTSFLASSQTWEENIVRTADHSSRFKPGLGERCALCHRNSEKVVKYPPFCCPGVLGELHQQHCRRQRQSLVTFTFQYLVEGEVDRALCTTVCPPSLPY